MKDKIFELESRLAACRTKIKQLENELHNKQNNEKQNSDNSRIVLQYENKIQTISQENSELHEKVNQQCQEIEMQRKSLQHLHTELNIK
jgi:hypothetical protein